MGSTLRAVIQQMWISDQSKLHQAITSHTDSIHIKYILQHVFKISANSEMVEQEAFVELS